ncbi:uncharacterized protein NMK_1892 [Novimethylophilus kurashikiensis]|uniref:Uncharacterized protein n=1 Tax=Novimethylophilus kurashikiensis TaxID=1825523 RepID=A0A2R5F7T6_9PROT|nr:hypothetical protein [Novimethylophilus kurashikiensis]GBG14302.1 uncharacterized protein NMK_1892 [Novimethylophilus kurashikiensis]
MYPIHLIPSLKAAGFKITNEPDLVDRLSEAKDWQAALVTLLRHGERIGIEVTRNPLAGASVSAIAHQFHLSPTVESELNAVLH